MPDYYTRPIAKVLPDHPLRDIGKVIATGQAWPRRDLDEAGLSGRLWSTALQEMDAEMERHTLLHRLRNEWFIPEYGFSIPCREAVEALVRLSPIIEVGAGTGHWAALLRNAGAAIEATDAVEPGQIAYSFRVGRHFEIEQMSASKAVDLVAKRERAWTVFCSWPSYSEDWLAKAVRKIKVGDRLALIGEGPGGCTGTPGLFRFLEQHFTEEDVVGLPQFPGIHDCLTIHRRVS